MTCLIDVSILRDWKQTNPNCSIRQSLMDMIPHHLHSCMASFASDKKNNSNQRKEVWRARSSHIIGMGAITDRHMRSILVSRVTVFKQ